MNILIFATLFLSLMTILTIFISKRFINKLDFTKKTKFYINIFLVFNLLGILGYMFSRYNPNFPNWAYFLLSLPIGIIFILFVATIIYEISSKVLNKIPMNTHRRKFFKKSLDISALAIASGINAKAVYNAQHIEVENVEVKIKNLEKEYTIVQLSDVHIGGIIDKEFISSLVKRVNTLNPDIVVITGDLVDTKLKYAKEALDEFKNLESKYGNYFIVGNHEYFHGVQSIIDYVNSLNIKTLENENVYIGQKNKGFFLAGVYDVIGYRIDSYKPDIIKALAGTKESPTVLLAHQPRFINEVVNVDLMLSGHTHGGQIAPFNYLVKLAQPYIRGLNQHSKDTQVYVNKGTGFWGPPMRLGASSEISYIRLLSKNT